MDRIQARIGVFRQLKSNEIPQLAQSEAASAGSGCFVLPAARGADPAVRRKGYGTEAIRIMLDLAFREYEMNRVAIGVVGLNTEALAFYERNGFRKEGIQEQGYYYNGEYSDFVMMRILASEWRR